LEYISSQFFFTFKDEYGKTWLFGDAKRSRGLTGEHVNNNITAMLKNTCFGNT